MLTFTQHLGTWAKPYNIKKKQVSALLDLVYSVYNFPLDVGVAFAGDFVNWQKNRFGFQFTLSKSW
jgi:hypothetical protein